jgi:hypothetical protein
MPGAYIAHAGTVEYFMLLHPRADGPVLGTYAGRPIAATIVDADGRRYCYAGVAPRLSNGRYDLDALRKGEWLVEPGLVYSASAPGPG